MISGWYLSLGQAMQLAAIGAGYDLPSHAWECEPPGLWQVYKRTWPASCSRDTYRPACCTNIGYELHSRLHISQGMSCAADYTHHRA